MIRVRNLIKSVAFYLIMLGIGGWVIMLGYNLYSKYYPTEVGHSYFDKNPVIENVLRPGDPIRWKVNYDHYTEGVLVDVTRELRCGIDLYSFTPISYTTEKGHVEFINSTLTVPLRATPSPSCSVHTTAHFHISPQKTVIIEGQTEEFSIIK